MAAVITRLKQRYTLGYQSSNTQGYYPALESAPPPQSFAMTGCATRIRRGLAPSEPISGIHVSVPVPKLPDLSTSHRGQNRRAELALRQPARKGLSRNGRVGYAEIALLCADADCGHEHVRGNSSGRN